MMLIRYTTNKQQYIVLNTLVPLQMSTNLKLTNLLNNDNIN